MMTKVIYKVQFCKLCVNAFLERPKTTHHNYHIMHTMFQFWFLTRVFLVQRGKYKA